MMERRGFLKKVSALLPAIFTPLEGAKGASYAPLDTEIKYMLFVNGYSVQPSEIKIPDGIQMSVTPVFPEQAQKLEDCVKLYWLDRKETCDEEGAG